MRETEPKRVRRSTFHQDSDGVKTRACGDAHRWGDAHRSRAPTLAITCVLHKTKNLPTTTCWEWDKRIKAGQEDHFHTAPRPLLARWGCRFGGWLQNLAVAQQALVHEAMQRFGGLQVRCRIPMRKMKDPANSNVASVDGRPARTALQTNLKQATHDRSSL